VVNVFIIHGAYGSPNENWIPWLKLELEKLGHTVYTPKFPTPIEQSLENWLNVFKSYEKYVNSDSIMISHSLGAPFILNYLMNYSGKIKASFFVAGFSDRLQIVDLDEINKTFVDVDFDWKRIKKSCERFYMIHSEDDHYVDEGSCYALANPLKVEPILVKHGGHFNTKSGYSKFPLLLDMIKKELS
jgi:predicted alpha/beta hydrolase family esterase